jgi:hypothetical protein
MSAKEENVNSLCMVVDRKTSSSWLSMFPSPPWLIRMFKTREGKIPNTIRLKVRAILGFSGREIWREVQRKKSVANRADSGQIGKYPKHRFRAFPTP